MIVYVAGCTCDDSIDRLHDTEDEASLKLAEYMYYGTAGLQDFEQALSIYKVVEEQTKDAEVKGHALFKLGMMHQFGDGGVLDIDHDMA